MRYVCARYGLFASTIGCVLLGAALPLRSAIATTMVMRTTMTLRTLGNAPCPDCLADASQVIQAMTSMLKKGAQTVGMSCHAVNMRSALSAGRFLHGVEVGNLSTFHSMRATLASGLPNIASAERPL